MALIQWWVGVVVLAAALSMGAVAWWLARPRRTGEETVPAANLDRVRSLPSFQALVRQEWSRRRVEVVLLLAAIAGGALLASRLVAVSDDSEEMRTREVVLCLDVSGSMRDVDADVLDTYVQLARGLEDERIGFVMFDGYAVTVFPLSTDRDYITEQLQEAKEALAGDGQIPGASAPQVGSSLIGDGLATCVQRFDHVDAARSRTVVLATDNVAAGDSIYTTAQAAKLAADAGVMVFGVAPEAGESRAADQLRDAARSTGGDIITIAKNEPTNVARIDAAITSQQKSVILKEAQARGFDLVWPGAILLLAGLAGSLVLSWRRP